MSSEHTIALAGNPNSGKTTLFNALTGARQHVGNYPGVTVERKEGTYLHNGSRMHIVDLPGTYSLTAYSMEEVVARDFLVNEKPRLVIDIIDASNLERHLYLAVQFLEMGIPLFIALNMIDVAKSRGVRIDVKKLSTLLGVPVIPMVARTGHGKKELMETAHRMVEEKSTGTFLKISYGQDLDQTISEMEKEIENGNFLKDIYPARWVALKYLENDDQVISRGTMENPILSRRLDEMVRKVADHLQATLDTYPEALIADHRYGYIHSILKQGVVVHRYDRDRLYRSDRIDKVVTHRFLGPLIMMAAVIGLYHFTFTYSELPVSWVESLFEWFEKLILTYLPQGLFRSLILSGIIDGVGGVVGFMPLIMMMFFCISLLEDSGYLARVAFMLDRVFSLFGLHGSSVMAFVVSGGIAGGCAVPGVLAARTLRSPRERLATLLTAPFMNCGAKLPVFALLIATFFADMKALLMFMITIISWVGALLVAKLLRMTVIKGDPTPFVMELPPYRLPMLKGLLIHTWERTWQYVKKAGTVILGISIIIWAMMTFPGLPEADKQAFEKKRQAVMASAEATGSTSFEKNASKPEVQGALKERLTEIDIAEAESALRNSIAGRVGTMLEKWTRFAGFNWQTNIALIGGFAAKEVIVSTLGTAYSLGEVDPEESLSLSQKLVEAPNWGPLSSLSLLIFIIFYTPCFVTVVIIAKESGSWKWGAFSMLFNTLLAFGLAVIIFQVGSALGY
jgi:ferrous iron transport protein B